MSHHHRHAMGSLGGIGYAASSSRHRHRASHVDVGMSDYQFSQIEIVSLEPHVTAILMYTNTESNRLSMILVQFNKEHTKANIFVYSSKPLGDNEKKTVKLANKVARAVGATSRSGNSVNAVPVEDLKPLFHEDFLSTFADKDAKCIVAVVNANYQKSSEGVDVNTETPTKEAWQYLINTKGMMALRGRQTQMYQELRNDEYIDAELFFKKNVQGALEAKDWAKILEKNRYLYEPRSDAVLKRFVRLDENLTEQHMKPIETLAQVAKDSKTGKLDFSFPTGAALLYVLKQFDTRKISGDQVIADSGETVAANVGAR
jgi:hypothetical protein